MRTLLISALFSMFMLTFTHSAKADLVVVWVNGVGDTMVSAIIFGKDCENFQINQNLCTVWCKCTDVSGVYNPPPGYIQVPVYSIKQGQLLYWYAQTADGDVLLGVSPD